MVVIISKMLFYVILLFDILIEHIIPLGSMVINSISKLTQLNQSSMYSLPNAPTLADLEDDTHEGTLQSYFFALEISQLISLL
jgi:hypothetical protein